jgi:hypothetical protein
MSNARSLFWGIAPEEVKPFWQSALVVTGQERLYTGEAARIRGGKF